MYGGVGIKSARGSGTSGYVSRNMGSLQPMRRDVRKFKEGGDRVLPPREADPGIVYHNALREIEVQLIHLRDKLEDEGRSENDIEGIISVRRKELRGSVDPDCVTTVPVGSSSLSTNSHTLAVESRLRAERAASALGIRKEPHEEVQNSSSTRARRARSRSRDKSPESFSSHSAPRDRHGRTYNERYSKS